MEVINEFDVSGMVKKKEEETLDLSVSQLEGVGAVTQQKLLVLLI